MSYKAVGWLAMAAGLLVCLAGTCEEKGKIGFISLKKISDESLHKKAFEEEIKKFLESKKADRDAIRQQIEDLETAKALSGPEQARKEDEKIQQKKAELLQFDKEIRQEIEKSQLKFEKEILGEIAEAVKEVAQAEGYTWVLLDEVLMCKNESADLTFRTLVQMNDKYLKSRSEPGTTPKEEGAPEAVEPLPVSAEDALIGEVSKSGVRDRYTVKEIQPRKGTASGSITMKGEGERVRFVAQYPKDMGGGVGGVVSQPMGNQSVWRFVGKVPLSGYTFIGLDANRPLAFILLENIGLVHLYGRGSVTFPDGHSVPVSEEQPGKADATAAPK
jgi:Skp family chaperone for outer membrane proteins